MDNIEDKLRDKRRETKLLRLDIEDNKNLALTGLSQSIISKDKKRINDLSRQVIFLMDKKEKDEKP